jgi:hypothetical protein
MVLLGIADHGIQSRYAISFVVDIATCAVQELEVDGIRAGILVDASKTPDPYDLELCILNLRK